MVEYEGVIGIVLSLCFPIVALIGAFVTAIKMKNRDTELRKAIISSNLDAESIKLLVEKPEKKSNKYSTLRYSCALIGVGLGVLVNYLLGLTYGNSFEPWFIIGGFMGVGLLVSFIVEYKLTKKEKEETPSEE